MPKSVALYTRISSDPDDLKLGVARQLKDTKAKAKALGWIVGEVYEDNGVSAYRRKGRPEWLRMLQDIREGKRDGLVVYDLDRVARLPRDLEDLLDLVESRRIPVAVVTGDIDLSTDNGVFMARLLVNVANKSSRDTGRRVARAKLQKAEDGIVGKSRFRPYGYTKDYESIPDEVLIVEEIFKRVTAGEGTSSISNDLNRRGIPSTTGGRWGNGAVRAIVINPVRTGVVTSRGKVIGPGKHKALITTDVFEAAQASFSARTKPAGFNTRKHLLSGFLICSKCGHRMGGAQNRYLCKVENGGCGRTSRKIALLDPPIIEALLDHLSSATYAPDVNQGDLQAAADRAQAEVTRVQAMYEQGALDLADWSIAMKVARQRLTEAQRELGADNAARRVRDEALDPYAAWENANLSQKRAMIGSVIESIALLPTVRGKRFEPNAIKINWR